MSISFGSSYPSFSSPSQVSHHTIGLCSSFSYHYHLASPQHVQESPSPPAPPQQPHDHDAEPQQLGQFAPEPQQQAHFAPEPQQQAHFALEPQPGSFCPSFCTRASKSETVCPKASTVCTSSSKTSSNCTSAAPNMIWLVLFFLWPLILALFTVQHSSTTRGGPFSPRFLLKTSKLAGGEKSSTRNT